MYYIDHTLYSLVIDPQAQNLFAQTRGDCHRHAAMLLKIPWVSALGVAILYNRPMEDAAAEWKEETGCRRKRVGLELGLFAAKREKKPAPQDAYSDCLACQVERETGHCVLSTLVETLRAGDSRMIEAVEENEGFCLYHPDLALAMDAYKKAHSILRRAEKSTELKTFIRKTITGSQKADGRGE